VLDNADGWMLQLISRHISIISTILNSTLITRFKRQEFVYFYEYHSWNHLKL